MCWIAGSSRKRSPVSVAAASWCGTRMTLCCSSRTDGAASGCWPFWASVWNDMDLRSITFDFPGFTHMWVRSRRGYLVLRQTTAKNRVACGAGLVPTASPRSAARPARASCPCHPGPLRLLWPDREQCSVVQLPLPGDPNVVKLALAPQSLGSDQLGPDGHASPPIRLADCQGRALEARRLSEPDLRGTGCPNAGTSGPARGAAR